MSQHFPVLAVEVAERAGERLRGGKLGAQLQLNGKTGDRCYNLLSIFAQKIGEKIGGFGSKQKRNCSKI
jgi:hypothetical protein